MSEELKPSAAEFALAKDMQKMILNLSKKSWQDFSKKGKISKEEYYEQIRKVGIESYVISPDQFQRMNILAI